MHVLSNEQQLQTVSGGFSAYDAGHNVGAAARAAFDVFVAMGSAYTYYY